jgi:hypothetical protein
MSPSAFFDDAIMPYCALTSWEAGIGSESNGRN